eukprot:762667-Hanusia_phi.AAC.10
MPSSPLRPNIAPPLQGPPSSAHSSTALSPEESSRHGPMDKAPAYGAGDSRHSVRSLPGDTGAGSVRSVTRTAVPRESIDDRTDGLVVFNGLGVTQTLQGEHRPLLAVLFLTPGPDVRSVSLRRAARRLLFILLRLRHCERTCQPDVKSLTVLPGRNTR